MLLNKMKKERLEKKKLQNERDKLHETFLNYLIGRLQKNSSIIDRHESLLTADEQKLIALEEEGLQKIREELKTEEALEDELFHAKESLQEYGVMAKRGETSLHDKIAQAREIYSEYEIKARSIRQTILKLLDNTKQRIKELKEKEEDEARQQEQHKKFEAEEGRKRMEELKIQLKKEAERLEKQLRLLKQGYESGFISNQSYELDKDKIERRMVELEGNV